MVSVWDITLGVFTGGAWTGAKVAGDAAVDAATGGSSAVNAIQDGAGVAKVVWANVSDYRMWRSLGWLVLGLLLLVLGLVLWNRKALGRAASVAAL